MTAQIQFFCSPQEETRILKRLVDGENTIALSLATAQPDFLNRVDVENLPAPSQSLTFCLWNQSLGELQWHDAMPALDDSTHRALVASIFDREKWTSLQLHGREQMLDEERSPVLIFRRRNAPNGVCLPSLLLAPASNMERVSPDFARWVTRSMSWVRRNSTKVHDWRKRSNMHNSLEFLTSTYAFPDALEEIEAGNKLWAIS